MEKDFTTTESLIFCQVCGASNLPESLFCKVCKAPISSLPFDEEEKLLNDFDSETFIIGEIKAIGEGLRDIKKSLNSFREELKRFERDIRVIFNGFYSLKEILEEKNILNFNEVNERWREKEKDNINIEDQLNYLNFKKDKILSKYKGKNFNLFAELIEKARRKFLEKDLKKAMFFLKKALLRDPKNNEFLNLLAFISLKNGDIKGANFYLKKSFSIEESPDVIFLKALVLSYERKYKKALEFLEKEKSCSLDKFLFNVMEGNLNFQLENYKEAIKFFEKALKFEENPSLRFLLFKSLSYSDKKEKSIEHLLKIKDIEPYREEALYNLGKINFGLNKNRCALNYFEELLEEYPQKLKYQLSYLFTKEKFDLKFFRETKREIEKIERKIKGEDFDNLSGDFYKLYKSYPEEKFYLLSSLLFLKENLEDSIGMVEKILKEKTYSFYKILVFFIYINFLNKNSKNRLVLKILRNYYEASNTALEKAFTSYLLSKNIYEIEKNEDLALKYAKESMILFPEDLKLYSVENYLRILYNLEKRRDIFETLKEITENLREAEAMLNLGKIALKEGNEKEAKEIFKNIRNLKETSRGIVYKYWNELFKEIRSYIL